MLTDTGLHMYLKKLVVGDIGIIGVPADIVTAFQFGIDQRPNASVNVTSFIACFVCSLFNGLHVYVIFLNCIILVYACRCSSAHALLMPSVSVSSETVYLGLNHLSKFSSDCKSQLRLISIAVLLYSWEELGCVLYLLDQKSRYYGGPFTTEQVWRM